MNRSLAQLVQKFHVTCHIMLWQSYLLCRAISRDTCSILLLQAIRTILTFCLFIIFLSWTITVIICTSTASLQQEITQPTYHFMVLLESKTTIVSRLKWRVKKKYNYCNCFCYFLLSVCRLLAHNTQLYWFMIIPFSHGFLLCKLTVFPVFAL